jgi:hypothetical protein
MANKQRKVWKTNMALEVEYLFWYFGVLLSFVGSDFFLAIMLTA